MEQALAAGFSCQPASSGTQVLQFYELYIGVPEAIGILLAFYFFFHIISLLALTLMYRQKR